MEDKVDFSGLDGEKSWLEREALDERTRKIIEPLDKKEWSTSQNKYMKRPK